MTHGSRRGRGTRAGPAAPDRGDLAWLDFDPQAGHEQAGHEQAWHEQAGRRPAVVLSPVAYNARTGLALCCPVTSRVKGYPFEVALPDGLEVGGVVLADQLRSLDWRARNVTVIARLPESVVSSVLARARALL